jgi:prepilin peptidase CpaA
MEPVNHVIVDFPMLAAWVFMVPVSAICLWIAWTDLKSMKILNVACLSLLAVFIILAPFLLGLNGMARGLAQGAVVLVLGFLFNAAGAFGAGDAKAMSVMALFVAPGDGTLVLMIFLSVTLAAKTAHVVARKTRLRALAPHWRSWNMGKKFPGGLILAGSLMIYLWFAAILGS